MKIYLIGMPLSGKTVIGEILANYLNFSYVDLDYYIELKEKTPIYELVKKDETKFRKLETEALKALINEEDLVISTGGGIVLDRNNKALMRGIIIYLDTPIEILEKRLDKTYQRPLLEKQTLSDLYEKRKHQYRYFQTYTIKTTTIEQTVDDIISKLKKENLL